MFVAFTAEEMGLVGSNYFGKTISPDSIIAGINIEMIGKESPFGPNSAWLTGFERSNFGTIIQKTCLAQIINYIQIHTKITGYFLGLTTPL